VPDVADGSDTSETGSMPVTPATGRLQVPPWVQLVGLPMLVLFGYLAVKAASHAVVLFLIAGLISVLLAPVVRSLVHSGIPRVLSVFLVFGMFASIVAVVAIGVVDLLSQQAGEVRQSADDIGQVAVDRIDGLQRFADHRGWNVDVHDQGVRLVHQLQDRSTELSGRALEFGREFVTVVAEAAFNLVLVIVITVYMLLDAPRIGRLFASIFPPDTGVEVFFGRLEKSLLRYTVGQSLASLVMGVSATVGLWVLGATGLWPAGSDYAVLFGLIVAVTEFAPSIGPVIGAVPPIATALFDGATATIAVALFFLLLHQIEGHIVIPKLMGAAIAVHPLLVIFGILAGAQVMGIGGVLLALPLLAVGREVVLFLRERLVLGRWPTEVSPASVAIAAAAGAADGAEAAVARAAEREQAGAARGGGIVARLRGALRRPEDGSADE
jgi:predicted PurR-regulated permease PerM